MALVDFPNVNGVTVCDCGNRTFYVGLEATILGEDRIRVLECSECKEQMAVPFQQGSISSSGTAPADTPSDKDTPNA